MNVFAAAVTIDFERPNLVVLQSCSKLLLLNVIQMSLAAYEYIRADDVSNHFAKKLLSFLRT